jgi:hypothetical protein
VAGSLYLFDSEESARGVSDIEVSYFDVDERLSAVTRSPVAVSQQT